MRRPEAALLALLLCAAGVRADEALLRWRAPVTVDKPGAFVQLALPASAYARVEQPGLQDLRVVDARGQRVPFALLEPRADTERSIELQRDASLYPLPPKPAADGQWVAPVDLSVEGNRITLRRRPGPAETDAVGRSGGWLVDTGDPAARPKDEPAPHALRLQWSGVQEFSAGYRLDLSDDLRQWRTGGAGQILSLAAAGGTLTQPLVALPAGTARFVRLVWDDPAASPHVTAVQALAARSASVVQDPPTELSVAPMPASPDKAAPGALVFDLGGVLPVSRVDLALPAGTRVVPVRLETRQREADPWLQATGAVFYRLERGGVPAVSPPLRLETRARYVRVVPDDRAAPLDPTATRLVVQARLASVVFAAQGEPPFALQAGAAAVPAGALPLATLVPLPDEERSRFGRASLGPWQEDAPAARRADEARRQAALRPWLLWGVLLAGVALLALMVRRLLRNPPNS